jgi:hypothetical protein
MGGIDLIPGGTRHLQPSFSHPAANHETDRGSGETRAVERYTGDGGSCSGRSWHPGNRLRRARPESGDRHSSTEAFRDFATLTVDRLHAAFVGRRQVVASAPGSS